MDQNMMKAGKRVVLRLSVDTRCCGVTTLVSARAALWELSGSTGAVFIGLEIIASWDKGGGLKGESKWESWPGCMDAYKALNRASGGGWNFEFDEYNSE